MMQTPMFDARATPSRLAKRRLIKCNATPPSRLKERNSNVTISRVKSHASNLTPSKRLRQRKRNIKRLYLSLSV